MNEQNLKPMEYKLSREEAKKGGINSGKARRKRKLMREQLEALMGMPLMNERVKAQVMNLGFKEKEIDNQLALTIAVFNKALQTGDYKVYEMIRDTLGEKPSENVNITNIPTVISGEDELED